jgi:predicted nuclease of restriction endonuclease-like (RecB) superfamily
MKEGGEAMTETDGKPHANVPQPQLFDRIVGILEQARRNVVRTVNHQMVVAYWLIGREIVCEIQKGQDRADYATHLMNDLSQRLTDLFGSGYSQTNLKYFRQFYQAFSDREPRLGSAMQRGSGKQVKCPVAVKSSMQHTGNTQSPERENYTQLVTQRVANSVHDFHPALGWTHYRLLMRVKRPEVRDFYETEAIKGRWSTRELERQINALLYERLLKSRDKAAVRRDTLATPEEPRPIDIIKDPYVLEFLDLPESHKLVESKIEEALIGKLQDFLLELGAGFAFIGRQKRLTLDGDHFYPDLVFYHTKLKCYVVIDLKTDKLAHQDLGQMLMYVHYYDREVCQEDDNPTVGLILCTDKNDAVVEYVLDESSERIFASRYQLHLPTEEELRRELIREHQLLMEEAGRWHLENNE